MTDSALLERERAAAAPHTPRIPSADAAGASAVAWGAILAGAAGAAALSLILLILGTGLGLSSVSPFTGKGASATTFGVSTIVWLTFTQLAAAGIGGYLAGRLRTRWMSTHSDEVYFRDTAHGFLAWAIATLVVAGTLSSVIGAIVGTGASAAGSVAGGAATAGAAATAGVAAAPSAGVNMDSRSAAGGSGYFVDALFRKDLATPAAGSTAAPGPSDATPSNVEASRIFASGLEAGSLPPDDVKYLAQLVSQRTGLPAPDAEKRVNDRFAAMKAEADQAKAQAKEAADKARKASAYAALWLFVSLLAGAFFASFMATFGGRRRDLV